MFQISSASCHSMKVLCLSGLFTWRSIYHFSCITFFTSKFKQKISNLIFRKYVNIYRNYLLNKWSLLYLRNWSLQQQFLGKTILQKKFDYRTLHSRSILGHVSIIRPTITMRCFLWTWPPKLQLHVFYLRVFSVKV